MNQITTQTRVGTGGVIHLDIPTDLQKDTNIDVTVTFELSQPAQTAEQKRREWLEFIECTAGALADDPITRPSQGEQPERNWPAGFFKDENATFEKSQPDKSTEEERREWLDFIDRTAGAWQGELERDTWQLVQS